jgi:hypothetical protein
LKGAQIPQYQQQPQRLGDDGRIGPCIGPQYEQVQRPKGDDGENES